MADYEEDGGVPERVLTAYQAWVGKKIVLKDQTAQGDSNEVLETAIDYSPYRICKNGLATREFFGHRLNFDVNTDTNEVTRVWIG